MKQAGVVKGQEVPGPQGEAQEGAGGFRPAKKGAEGAIDPIGSFEIRAQRPTKPGGTLFSDEGVGILALCHAKGLYF